MGAALLPLRGTHFPPDISPYQFSGEIGKTVKLFYPMNGKKKALVTAFVIFLMLIATDSSVAGLSYKLFPTSSSVLQTAGLGLPQPNQADAPATANSSRMGVQVIHLVDWDGERANQVAFSPDGKLLAVASSVGIHLYDTQSLSLVLFIPSETWVRSLAFSPDGNLLAGGSYDHSVRLWRTTNGTLVRTLPGATDQVHSVAFSPNGQLLAAAADDDALRIWHVPDGSLLKTIRQGAQGVRAVTFSPDGTMLASGGSDGIVRLWRVADGSLLHELQGHTSWVRTVAFSPDGSTLASGSFDQTARLWRVSDGSLLFTLKGHSASVLSVAFSPDGKTLATGSVDKTIGLWRVADGTLVDVLARHTNFIFSVAFSPEGNQLASDSMDGSVRVWDLATGQPFSPGVTTTSWVGEPAPQECVVCHHPRGDYRPAPVSDVRCTACHAEGASMFWDPTIPRDPDPVTGKLSNDSP
jgi:WD40 repeat protein